MNRDQLSTFNSDNPSASCSSELHSHFENEAIFVQPVLPAAKSSARQQVLDRILNKISEQDLLGKWGPKIGRQAHGSPWGPMGCPLATHGCPRAAHGRPWGTHGSAWKFMGRPCRPMGAHWEPMVAHGPPMGSLGHPWGVYGPGICFQTPDAPT